MTGTARAVTRLVALLLALAAVAAACSSVDGPYAGPDPTDPPRTDGSADETEGGADDDRGIPRVAAPDPDPTPIPVDPAVRFGTLENGLTYYLRENRAPGSSLDLRLVVDAGSLQQEPADSGGAHFLEHMLFNGTEQFPGNELDRSLQRLGIQFGPDLNAFTNYDETVYLLGATTLDPEAVEMAFDVLAQWASAATLRPDAVADEIGVVREEWRERLGTSDGIVQAEFLDIYTAGTVYEGHDVLGSEAAIDATTAGPLRAHYDRWYRPDNMAVVIVGDLPVDRMEQEVRSRFEGLVPRDPTVPDSPDRLVEPTSAPSGHVVTHPDQVIDNLSFDIPLTPWDPGTIGGERLQIMEALIATMLTDRMAAAVDQGELSLVSPAFLERFGITRGLQYLGTNLQAPDLELVLDELMGLFLGLARDGFEPADLARAAEVYGADLDATLDSLTTRQDWEWATAYQQHYLTGTGIDAVAATVERRRRVLDDLQIEDLTDHWRWILQVGGPIAVAVGADEADLPTPERLIELVTEASPVATATTQRDIDELMAPPDPVEPVSVEWAQGAFAPSRWTFDNGVQVVHVESDIDAGFVDLRATANGGWSTLQPGTSAVIDFVMSAVGESGFGDVTRLQLDRFLAGASVDLDPYIAESDEGFDGAAAADDVELLFQLLHLSITEPRADEDAVAIALNDAANTVDLAETDPGTRSWIELVDARTGGSPAYRVVPTQEQVDALDGDTMLEIYRSRLGDVDDLVVAVVGDVGADEIDDLVRRYLGTLPAGAPDSWTDRLPPMPSGVTRRVVELDDDITAAGIDVWYATDIEIDGELLVTARVLETILSTRILDTVREELGASYGGSAVILPDRRPRERADVFIDLDGDPDRLDTILDTVDAQIAELRTTGPTADEFERAVAVLADEYEFIDNELFLTAALDEAHFPDADRVDPLGRARALATVGRNDVQALAERLFPLDQRIEVVRTTP